MSVLPSHAPSNLVAEEHLQHLVIYSRGVICLYIDVDIDISSSAARLFDTSPFMMIIHVIINGLPTSGLAIHRWGRDTFSDQIRLLKPNLFSDAPRNVLSGVNALRFQMLTQYAARRQHPMCLFDQFMCCHVREPLSS
jgi:hypothetical protein